MLELARSWIAHVSRARVGFTLLPVSLWLVFQYRWVLDDAFVYFRYAENFAQTGQLVFNVNEYVEGYTSPAWMLLCAATRSAGLRFWPVILAVGFMSTVLFFALGIRTNDALSTGRAEERGEPQPRLYLPLALLGTNYAVLSHFTSGLETPWVQVSAAAFACSIVRPSDRVAQGCMAVAPLVRPELGLAFLVALSWTWWRRRRFPLLLGLGGIGLQLAWLAFRLYYYRDLLPNTFYLKSNPNWVQGLWYLWDSVGQYGIYLWLLLFVAGTATLGALDGVRRSRLPERAVIALGALLVTAHVVRIGGDFVHYRYLAFPLCALFASFGGVAEGLVRRIRAQVRRWSVVATVGGAVSMALSYPGYQLPRHPIGMPRNDAGLYKALVSFTRHSIEDAARHRRVDLLAPEHWDAEVASTPVPSEYSELFIGGWCALSYQLLDVYSIHSFGLTNAFLARLPARANRQAGHKWTLHRYALDLAKIYSDARSSTDRALLRRAPRRGSLRATVLAGAAPRWVQDNLPELEIIEGKIFGERNVRGALEFAWQFPELSLDDPVSTPSSALTDATAGSASADGRHLAERRGGGAESPSGT